MTVIAAIGWSLRRHGILVLTLAALGLLVAAPSALAVTVPGSLSDIRVSPTTVTTTLTLRSDTNLKVDQQTVTATLGGKQAKVTVVPAADRPRSTMLVIDTSGSMGASGMATVRSAVKDFLAEVPKDVKVGVVSFASTAGVDVPPTTDHAKVSKAVASLQSAGETSLYRAVKVAVKALGTEGERSMVLLSDGGDTVAQLEGGDAQERGELSSALGALKKAKVRAEVVAFKSAESNGAVLKQFAAAGGGSVANAADSAAVSRAFTAAARALDSQTVLTIERPTGVADNAVLLVTGTASGQNITASSAINLGDTAPVEVPATTNSNADIVVAPPPEKEIIPTTAVSPALLVPTVLVVGVGLFALTIALVGPSFRSKRSQRIQAIDAYGFGRGAHQRQRQSVTPTALSEQLVSMGDRVMEGRESTTKTMQLLDRADLPWRAGEWFVLRLVAIVIAGAVGFLLFNSHALIGLIIGVVVGVFLPPFALRYLARRRTKKFEAVLPDVLMLVATSLASGFSLLQALDSVAKDAPEPAAKEFSRALAEARIGADVSDALEHAAIRMDSENMRWAVMAIRIQREVGGNLAETLRTTAATLREREMLRRQVRALSAEGRLSAYILVALPILVFFYTMWVNYDYVSLLWTTLMGLGMSVAGLIAMIIGIFWMRKVVQIEV